MWRDPAVAAVLNPATLVPLWLGGFIGAVASGGAGFAFALAASSIWLHVFDPVHATLLIVACSTALQIGTIWPLRRHIKRERLWPFLAAGLAGVPVGVELLAHTNPGVVKSVLGLFLTAFGVYALAAPRLPVIGGTRAVDALVGFGGGILGGIGGYSGVLPTIWTQLRGWPKWEARAVYQPFIIVMQAATLLLVGIVALDSVGILLLVTVSPAVAAGGFLGWRLYGHLDERRFRQMLALLLIGSSVMLVL